MVQQILEIHREYFNKIDTKDKAYWLGFLYADGNIERKKKGSKRVSINIHKKDEWIIDQFIKMINANKNNKYYYKDNIRIRIYSTELANDLIKHGCVPRKSKIIKLPLLDSRELYLAFLLGFFDGDGTQNRTKITTGSLVFLEQIKEKFNLSSKITKKHSDNFCGRKIDGTSYDLYLGADLFNEMMDNYTNSLPRKRRKFLTKDEKSEKASDSSKNNTGKKKFEITKEELEKLVWEIPTTKIAKIFGVSGKAIEKRCKKFGIQKPSWGYWQKQYSIIKKGTRINKLIH